ncbi:MAG: hypothetical protein OEV30_08710, partial [Ignavibacteria bacterium]|nr:hypothetical protein [Ignavibacteria bacterium]
YESYPEWLASPYAAKGVTCQDCHMPPDSVTTNFAPGRGGLEREAATIPSHFQLGSRDSAFLASAVEMKTTGTVSGGELIIRVEITNVAAGHHVPTDQPMRNMILLVTATAASGRSLDYLGEEHVPYWGGSGDPADGNYEGLPGKGFAKILYERNPQYVSSANTELQKQISPAPQWRIIDILSDNRIPAMATDTSHYRFAVADAGSTIEIRSELIYRRTFRNWAAMKQWEIPDVVMARNTKTIRTDN